MSKSLLSQKLILKVSSSRFRKAKWNLKLDLATAMENDEVITLASSQTLRFIDEIHGRTSPEITISFLKDRIERLKRDFNKVKTLKEIRMLYEELQNLQYEPDYICVVMDKNSDFDYMCHKPFYLNGQKYVRFLATTGGAKKSTVVFINENIAYELNARIDNGRNMEYKIAPAKLEAYKALACSASNPVSMPNGIIVVEDVETNFLGEAIKLDDSDYLDEETGEIIEVVEPVIENIKDYSFTQNTTDGFGLGMPSLMERWGHDIEENYQLSGCVIRNSFCKGGIICVDFQKFFAEHGVTHIKDCWGIMQPVNNVEMILTTSMLKLWEAYDNLEDYLYNCKNNNYTFAITKACPEELENQRTMNYQFLQTYDFSEEDLEELLQPTIEEIKGILGVEDDYGRLLLYLKGENLNENNAKFLDNTYATALMIDKRLRDDPHIKKQIFNMIERKINDAKIGVINVPANYAMVCGDPYILCQHMIGLEPTGLLKGEEIFSKYWVDRGVKKVACFRAPMSCHNNIRVMNIPECTEEMLDFYKHIKTVNIISGWSSICDALNGCDFDGDIFLTTSSDVIIRNTRTTPTIVCVQRKAEKKVPTEEDLIESNKLSFGNSVGSTTNKITNMTVILERFEKGSREYETLEYRIACGQLYQQNSIDKSKGIIAKPMPKHWYDFMAIPKAIEITEYMSEEEKQHAIEFNKERDFQLSILADKKPYFMQYVYPQLRVEYKAYEENINDQCFYRFDITYNELTSIPLEQRTEEQNSFIDYAEKLCPLNKDLCTINKICYRIEREFDDYKFNLKKSDYDFDYSILKSDVEYDSKTRKTIEQEYKNFTKKLSEFKKNSSKERIKADEASAQKSLMNETFKQYCYKICPNKKQLCNIVVDIVYEGQKSKQFAWDICGDVIIENLLEKNEYKINYPTKDINGNIEFNGNKYSLKQTIIDNKEIEVC